MLILICRWLTPLVDYDVVCVRFRIGGREAATFCALSTLQDQLEQDNCVDVYLTAKLYHPKRPGVFPSQVRSYLAVLLLRLIRHVAIVLCHVTYMY